MSSPTSALTERRGLANRIQPTEASTATQATATALRSERDAALRRPPRGNGAHSLSLAPPRLRRPRRRRRLPRRGGDCPAAVATAPPRARGAAIAAAALRAR